MNDWLEFNACGFQGERLSGFPENEAVEILGRIDDFLGGRAGNRIRHALMDTGKHAWEYETSFGKKCFIKYHARRAANGAWYTRFKERNAARGAFEIQKRLLASGIDVPRPLFFAHRAERGRTFPSITISRAMTGYQTLHHYLFEKMARPGPEDRTYAQLIRAVIGPVARFHAMGYAHGDLNPYNILIDPAASEPAPGIGITDFDDTRKRYGPKPGRHMLNDLCTLGAMLHNVIPESVPGRGLMWYCRLMGLNIRQRRRVYTYCRTRYKRYMREFENRFDTVSDALLEQAARRLDSRSRGETS